MIYLLIELYNSEFENRNLEMKKALDKNLECENVDRVVIFHEPEVQIPEHDKIIRREISGRMMFADFFTYSNTYLRGNNICIVANSDIYFDETLDNVSKMQSKDFLCLSRWSNNELEGDCFSQDSWIFKSVHGVPSSMIIDSAFTLGELGCDNRIAFNAIKYGYKVKNPAMLIRSHHLHKVFNERSYDNNKQPKNMLHMSTIEPSSTMNYDENKIGSFSALVGSSRMVGYNYIELAKSNFSMK